VSDFLYEKDLTSMKYSILTSPRHDRMIREIANDLDVPVTRLRRFIMDRFDMILMENLPARYEQGRKDLQTEPFPDRELGSHLYSRAVPIIDEHKMEEIIRRVKELMNQGVSEKEAVATGKTMVRKAITG
jgi:energy-converting hydrogenase A subunit M